MNSDNLRPVPFAKGNPGGNFRPEREAKGPAKGLAKQAREKVDDGAALIELWASIAMDPMRRDSDRLKASELLADRGWGKAANFVRQEGDPLELSDAKDRLAAKLASVARLDERRDESRDEDKPATAG